jgi:hypothetical protein
MKIMVVNQISQVKQRCMVVLSEKSDFLVSLEVAVFIFSYTLNLSHILQSKQQDLSKALNDVVTVRESLESIRRDVDIHLKKKYLVMYLRLLL